MADPADSVRRFRAELADAVGRSRRARDEAHHRAEVFQRHTTELAKNAATGSSAAESVQRAVAIDYRTRVGLEVPEYSAIESNVRPDTAANESAAGKSQEQTPSDGSDLDFSQAQIMR
ncbi:hypothetical protein [Saccharopolyspora sp. ASAGF58]|uniref:hypothetical protein n=1 Tax=Saccharopolyspora TaxID=1835 RepID=UPI0014402FD0|nr:hypothetical protein [Saccharopolyspora sp. ASAGF58]QIZ34788.1 hypothetical protein FDZ84_08730 [Saccharopolyspora sp. ASAGF58]